jgi:hypothetical protein
MRKQPIRDAPSQNEISARRSHYRAFTRSRSPASQFSVEVHIRGECDTVHYAVCAGLEQALHFVEAQIPTFTERNPWIGLDSLRRKIWILLDPS